MKLVEKNSRVGKVIVQYFNNSNVTDKKIELQNIWSVNRKCVNKKFYKIDYDTSKTILLWNDRLYHQDLPTLLINGWKIIHGHKPTYRLPERLYFYDRIMDSSLISTGKQDRSGVLILSEVCIDKMETLGAYNQKPERNYYCADSYWKHGIYKTMGRNIPDSFATEYMGTCKVPVGQTTPSLKFDDQQWQQYNSYWIGDESRLKLKFIVNYTEI